MRPEPTAHACAADSTGAFVVTQRRPVAPDEDGQPFCGACSHYHEGPCLCPDCGRPTPCRDHGQDRSVSTPATEIVYREAFATLEDRNRAICVLILNAVPIEAQPDLFAQVTALGESGGKLSLPNGDVIEVEATTDCAAWENEEGWHVAEHGNDLAILSSDSESAVVAAWCATWNAEHGIGIKARA
ncbi:MAG TPA: hypothetical protein VFS37_09020 [Conexibacter sp.]|nr:hypothetical protein [Conexibacter sp.]